ncbi:MAG: mechanosensitive ion channel [Porticoccus sp.]|nr:mechanosensitive ion channel [Porticoccus sp.]
MKINKEFFQTTIVQFGDTSVSLADLIYAPILLLAGILFIRWSAKLIRSMMTKQGINPNLIQVISRAYLIIALSVLVISALDLMNVPLTAFAFISGAVAIGFGFGAQNIINNFISGWILMWERPIRIGDFLEIGDTTGTVESINTRSTQFRRVDGVHMLIPNSYLLENILVNWTLVDKLTRTTVRVGIAYGSPVRKAAELIELAAKEHPDVLKDPATSVLFEDFGDSALIFDLHIWVNASAERSLRKIRSDLRYKIDDLFHENNIVIAFPQRDIHIDGEVVIKKPQA